MEEKELLQQQALLAQQGVNPAKDIVDEYSLGEEIEFEIPEITHNIHSTTHQGMHKDSVAACTIYGAVNQIIRLFGIDLSNKDANKLALEAVDFATNYGYVKGDGWWTYKAINTVVKWWNQESVYTRFPNAEKVFFVRYDNYKHPKVVEAMEKGHYVGFTYNMNYGNDYINGLIDKDSYPTGIGHRTNWKKTALVKNKKVTCDTCDCGVHDSYYGPYNEYYIKDRAKYMYKGMFPTAYLIMPESYTKDNIEKKKQEKKEVKAINALIGMLSTTYAFLPEDMKPKAAEIAKALREQYPEARRLVEDEKKKSYQMVADALSFAWKQADDRYREAYALLAKILRDET